MDPFVGAEFGKRNDAGGQLVVGAQCAGVLRVVAVGIALRLPGYEMGVLIPGCVDVALHDYFKAIEPLRKVGTAAQRGVDRQPREIRLDEGAAGPIGADDEAP
jgi:hypothetical protein